MFISIERYIGVKCPLRYPVIVTHRRTVLAIALAWIVAVLVSIVPFLGWQKQVKSTENTCEVNDNRFYALFSCSFSFYIPLIVILCVYGRIYAEATRQYRFLADGQKRVRLKDMVGQEVLTLRIHLPKHLSTSTSLSNGLRQRSMSNDNRLVSQIMSTGSSKISRMKRERKAGKYIS